MVSRVNNVVTPTATRSHGICRFFFMNISTRVNSDEIWDADSKSKIISIFFEVEIKTFKFCQRVTNYMANCQRLNFSTSKLRSLKFIGLGMVNSCDKSFKFYFGIVLISLQAPIELKIQKVREKND